MNRTITTVLILVLFISCDRKTDFQNDYISKINSTDRIEIKVISDGQKKSIVFADKERLEFLKEILKPKNLIPRQLTDDLSFPIDITLYEKNKVMGQMGIQYGHIQYIYYKREESFDYKAEINEQMSEFIDLVNQELKDK
jgi:hypothetical protein